MDGQGKYNVDPTHRVGYDSMDFRSEGQFWMKGMLERYLV